MKYSTTLCIFLICTLSYGCKREASSKKANKNEADSRENHSRQHNVSEQEAQQLKNLDTKEQLPPGDFKQTKPRRPKVQNFQNSPDSLEDQLLSEFSNEISKIGKPNSTEYYEKMTQMWQDTLNEVFERPLEEQGAAITNGEELPKEAIGLILTKYKKDILPFSQSSNEIRAGRWLAGLAAWESIYGGHLLPELLQPRSNQLPSTEKDLAILYASLQGIHELNLTTNKAILEEWEPLANAKNPIYRLIALKASVSATPKQWLNLSSEDQDYNKTVAPEKVQFYRNYLNETDPTIILTLVESIRIHPSKESFDLLSDLSKNPVVAQSKELQKLLENRKKSLSQYK